MKKIVLIIVIGVLGVQSIKSWNSSLKDVEIIAQSELDEVKQQFTFGDSTQVYTWKIIPTSDSTSRVKVYIKDPDHSLANRLSIPFSKTAIEQRSENMVKSKRNDVQLWPIKSGHVKKPSRT